MLSGVEGLAIFLVLANRSDEYDVCWLAVFESIFIYCDFDCVINFKTEREQGRKFFTEILNNRFLFHGENYPNRLPFLGCSNQPFLNIFLILSRSHFPHPTFSRIFVICSLWNNGQGTFQLRHQKLKWQ